MSTKSRLTLDLPQRSKQRLQKLQKLSESGTLTETVVKALKVYETLLKRGSEIEITSKGKTETLILI